VRELLPSWDVKVVLRFLKKVPFEPLSKCGLQSLTFKTVFLVALASARRCSELQALGRASSHLRFENEGVRLRTVVGFLPKTATPNHLGRDIFLPSYEHNDKELCVVRCLKRYLKVTKTIMSKKQLSHNHLFVCYGHKSQGNPVSKRTISGWLVKTIKAAYAAAGKTLKQKVRAHSTRAQAASWAAFNGVPIEEIFRAADWRCSKTFLSHYGLDLAVPEAAFSQGVMAVSSQQ
jgi:integrase